MNVETICGDFKYLVSENQRFLSARREVRKIELSEMVKIFVKTTKTNTN